MLRRPAPIDVIAAGTAGAVLGGLPSTVHALATGLPVTEAAAAAGTLVLDERRSRVLLVAAAIPIHLALSVGWAAVLTATLPPRRPILAGMASGLAIAALDLGLIGRRFPRIRALPMAPQVADHLAYGAAVGGTLARRWRRSGDVRG